MQGHTLHALERVTTLRHQAVRLQTLRDRIAGEKETREREIVELTKRQDALVKVNELFRLLLDRLILGQIQKISSLVTQGIQAIGWRSLRFEADVSYKYNRVAVDFYFAKGDLEKGGFRAPPLGSFGGGPSSVAALLLRILVLLRLKRRPILFLDESLLAVSQEYVDATSDFLRKFSTKSGVNLLLVTHNPGFMEAATMAYQAHPETDPANPESDKLVLRKIRG